MYIRILGICNYIQYHSVDMKQTTILLISTSICLTSGKLSMGSHVTINET